MTLSTFDLRSQYLLDPRVAYLNHGAFGATAIAILEERERLLRAIEANPTRMFMRELKADVDAALEDLALVLKVPSRTLAFTSNATVGLNLVARSLMPTLHEGDEVLLTDVEYGSQLNLWEFVCERRGARLRVVPVCGVPADDVPRLVESHLSDRTRIMLMSHITSLTALRLPVEEVSGLLRRSGVTFVVDGAHAPGHIPLDLPGTGADYYVANLHKWFAAPRPSGFIYANAEAQSRLDPLVVNWGGTDRGTSLAERTHYPGTADASPWLTVPAALAFHEAILSPARPHARALLADAAEALAALSFERLGREDDDLLMSSWWLPPGLDADALRAELASDHIEAIVDRQGDRPVLRACVAWYTLESEVNRLLDACGRALERPSKGNGTTE
ncbi:MAG TPA: aminotransferase class V-fold PLP-dependent enzyme [Acidimicrobiales bacterium]|nr:aminotransferase class V-fold PLP-dependent enzyme [Acidimicrobiales bacterium]